MILAGRLLSPLSRNILIINLITLMIPAFGFFYLADHRRELIRSELENLQQVTLTFTDSLAEGSVKNLQGRFQYFEINKALQVLRRVSRQTDTRAILFLSDGTLIADTQFLQDRIIVTEMDHPEQQWRQLLRNFYERFHSALNYLENFDPFEKYQWSSDIHIHAFPHAIKALEGNAEVKIWMGKNRSELVMSVAAPVQPLHRVYGVLVVTRTSTKVEETIRDLRHNVLITFLIAMVFTITMSLLLARQIARPLSRLARAAKAIGQPNIPLKKLSIPILNPANDEIGILARALWQMTENLKQRITSIEGFAADVAHEIRNPISAISSALETMQIVKSEQQRAELLAMAQAELSRIDVMIDEILESSRLDAALHEENREYIDVVQWLEQFKKTFHDLHHNRALIMQLPQKQIWVSVKETRMTQIMQNLLSNAFDFQPEGKPIYLTVEAKDHWVHIEIMDQGIGIPEQSLEKIFERFYCDRPPEKESYHTGLGLSIVKQVIEGYNGTISARNRPPPETGAIFQISLPTTAQPSASKTS